MSKHGKSLYNRSELESAYKIHIKKLDWSDRQQIFVLKLILKSFIQSNTFNTNILKIWLNRNEEHLASIIVSHYQIKMDDNIINRAIDTNMLTLLKTIFTYSKNLQMSNINNPKSYDIIKKKLRNFDSNIERQSPKIYTINYVINRIYENNIDVISRVETVLKWGIRTTENVLLSILEKSWDKLAIKYSEFYIKDADSKLLKFWLYNENEEFLKHSFNNYLFLDNVLNSEETISILLTMLENKVKWYYIINIMLYVDFENWPNEHFGKIVEIFDQVVKAEWESNLLLLMVNPILALSIMSEILCKIGKISKVYKRTANEIALSFQKIGLKISLQLNEELIEKMYLDTDFQGRTLLRIIVDNSQEDLVKWLKIDDLIERIWTGKDTFECDGRLAYYSKLKFLSKTSLRILPGKEFSLKDLIKQGFEIQTHGENFWYQFDYRRYSIKYIFAKEFFSAVLMVIVITYIAIQYISMFIRDKFTMLSYKEQYAYIQHDIDTYQGKDFFFIKSAPF